jgi:hypothetical protein
MTFTIADRAAREPLPIHRLLLYDPFSAMVPRS